ncbi:hypothetical protein WN51_09564 [Melipona quadrifasciata]|uniref:Uncharacterized protein n=1 Tax=Melipona quadrifasciata TaxID=166423 RepID=A0A0M9A6F6_9HYME|nr:hypothetical protein WN51_09564 [Melipona quadrifasciata]
MKSKEIRKVGLTEKLIGTRATITKSQQPDLKMHENGIKVSEMHFERILQTKKIFPKWVLDQDGSIVTTNKERRKEENKEKLRRAECKIPWVKATSIVIKELLKNGQNDYEHFVGSGRSRRVTPRSNKLSIPNSQQRDLVADKTDGAGSLVLRAGLSLIEKFVLPEPRRHVEQIPPPFSSCTCPSRLFQLSDRSEKSFLDRTEMNDLPNIDRTDPGCDSAFSENGQPMLRTRVQSILSPKVILAGVTQKIRPLQMVETELTFEIGSGFKDINSIPSLKQGTENSSEHEFFPIHKYMVKDEERYR